MKIELTYNSSSAEMTARLPSQMTTISTTLVEEKHHRRCQWDAIEDENQNENGYRFT